jgi:hypothetical protein
MSLPVPDLKPHVAPPPGSERCGCCDGIIEEIPQDIINRDGLSAIDYRIGDHAQFRGSLQALLSSTDFPALDDLRTRADADFTIGLLDAYACSADVLTFYQERIANETYLRTATERVSLQEMGKLIGYRLRPGVAAETWLAFALETPPKPPANLAPEPGNFITGVPATVKLDKGLKVQSVPGPGEKPQTFETGEELSDARPEWSGVRPWLAETKKPGRNDRSTYLAGVKNNLRPGDALLFLGDEFLADKNNNNWDFRLIDTVALDTDADRTFVSWKRGLGSVDPYSDPTTQSPQVHVLRKRAAVFGHNAPAWGSMGYDFRRYYPGGRNADNTFVDEWPGFTLSTSGPTADGGYVDTDATYAEVRNSSFVVLAKGGFNYSKEPAPSDTYIELYEVINAADVSRAEFAISGKVSRLQLRGANYSLFEKKCVRKTAVFLQSEELKFAEYPVTDVVQGDRIPASVGADGLLPGRRLIICGERTSDKKDIAVQATLVKASSVGAGRCQLEITPPLAEALRRDTVVVYANVVLASHGESVSQVLGNGDASQPFQRFELKQTPLTFRAAENEIGAAAELKIQVGDIRWRERPSLYGAKQTDRAYTLSTDEQGRQFVVFGDGVSGARLPTSVNNIRAAYRKGLGVDGNVKAETLTQLMSRPLGLKSASNPLPAEGGADPETASNARQTMPLYTRTLGRVVSLLDYEDYARAFSGVAKARAQILQLGSGTTIAITIAGPKGKVITSASPTWINLIGSLQDSGDPFVAVQLQQHQASSFRIGIKVKCDLDREPEKVLADVEAALRAAFSFDVRELGQPVQQSEVIVVAQAVPGVIAVDLIALYGGTTPAAQVTKSLQPRLLASRMRVQAGIAKAAEILTLDPGPFDTLEAM